MEMFLLGKCWFFFKNVIIAEEITMKPLVFWQLKSFNVDKCFMVKSTWTFKVKKKIITIKTPKKWNWNNAKLFWVLKEWNLKLTGNWISDVSRIFFLFNVCWMSWQRARTKKFFTNLQHLQTESFHSHNALTFISTIFFYLITIPTMHSSIIILKNLSPLSQIYKQFSFISS